MATETLTAAGLLDWLAEESGIDRRDCNEVLKALASVVPQALAEGYGVNIKSLVKLEPAYVEAKPRRKGINPFEPEKGEQWLAAKPAKFRVKAKALSRASAKMPSVKSKAGKGLAEALRR